MNCNKQSPAITVKCPYCKKETVWTGNPCRPFCSERCKIIDLGNWADGKYAIPAQDDTDEEDAADK